VQLNLRPVFCSLLLALAVAVSRAAQSPANGYVGAEACAPCHRSVHDTWASGRHSRMIQRATPSSVKGDFTAGTVTLRGRQYGVRARGGEFFITESELGGRQQEHHIDYTLGSRRIQHYLTTIDHGKIVVMAPSWDVQRREWFHNTDIIRPDEDDRLVVQQWNKQCVGCHVSRQEQHYDPKARTYATGWTDFGTSCERCHGPGRAHVAERTRATIVRPTRLTAEAATGVCAQCHSLRTAINPAYAAGDDYYDAFVPTLEYAPYARPHASQDPPYWADGRPRRFSNDAIGLWQSACYLKGGATCTTCHADPHLPNVDQNPQLAPAASNTLCAKCHQEIVARAADHSRHRAGNTAGAGPACVDCHMPKTVVSIKSTMRDHTIGVPAPENTVKFGIPNACSECHKDKPAAWAVDTLRVWYPDGRRARLVARAEAFGAARAGKPEAIEPLVAIAEGTTLRGAGAPVVEFDPLSRANALGYLGNYADPAAQAALVKGAQAGHPAIRAIAIAAMRAHGRGNPDVRRAVLRGLGDPQRSVRVASLLTLVAHGDEGGGSLAPGDRARFRGVSAEFLEWSRGHQDDADLQRLEGIVDLLNGDAPHAADALAIGYDLEPDMPSLRFFLGIARLGQQRVDEARALFSQVPKGDPFYELAQQRLRR
jgi:hypothetical protein